MWRDKQIKFLTESKFSESEITEFLKESRSNIRNETDKMILEKIINNEKSFFKKSLIIFSKIILSVSFLMLDLDSFKNSVISDSLNFDSVKNFICLSLHILITNF
jgi:hypothetical protein